MHLRQDHVCLYMKLYDFMKGYPSILAPARDARAPLLREYIDAFRVWLLGLGAIPVEVEAYNRHESQEAARGHLINQAKGMLLTARGEIRSLAGRGGASTGESANS